MSQVTNLINHLKIDETFEIYQREIDTLIVKTAVKRLCNCSFIIKSTLGDVLSKMHEIVER